MKISTKQITFLGMILVFAMMVSYIERLIPPLIPTLPGIKLGLANIVVLILMYLRGYKTALCLNVLRVLLTGLLFTGVWGTVYAMAGALLSFAAMSAFKASRCFGVVGVSVIGGACHNLGQICVAVLVMDSVKLFYYFPVLLISGVITGALIGYLAGIVINRLNAANFDRMRF